VIEQRANAMLCDDGSASLSEIKFGEYDARAPRASRGRALRK